MKIVNNKNMLGFAGTMALALTVATPTTSYASDEKILPGSICQPTSVDTSAKRMFYMGGSVVNFTNENNGVQVARLHCPMVRDKITQPWKKIYVRVRDNTTSAEVTCTASNHTRFADQSFNVTQSSGNGFTGFKSLVFSRPSGDYDTGAFNIYCSLPGNTSDGGFSAIHSIRLIEE